MEQCLKNIGLQRTQHFLKFQCGAMKDHSKDKLFDLYHIPRRHICLIEPQIYWAQEEVDAQNKHNQTYVNNYNEDEYHEDENMEFDSKIWEKASR